MSRTAVVPAVAVGVAFAIYATVLFANVSYSVAGTDTSGYMNTARLLAEGSVRLRVTAVEELGLSPSTFHWFIPYGFVAVGESRELRPLYPLGYPLHLAFAGVLFGFERAPYWINPLATLVTITLTWLLARALDAGRFAATAAAAVMALCPVFIFHGLHAMGDVVAAVWVSGTLLLVLRGQSSRLTDLAAGACFGMSVFVRPTNAVIALAVVLMVRFRFRRLAAFAAGAVPFAIVIATYNDYNFGNWLTSGYTIAGLQNEFHLANFPPRFGHYAEWTVRQFGPFVPIAAVAFVLDRRAALSVRGGVAAAIASFFILFSLYGYHGPWWTTRFLVPIYPMVVAAAAAGVDRWRQARSPGAVRAAVAVMLVITLALQLWMCRKYDVLYTDEAQSIFKESAVRLAATAPTDSLVLASEMSGALIHYTDLVPVVWNTLDDGLVDYLTRRAAKSGRRVYALLMEFETAEFGPKLGSRFHQIDRLGQMTTFSLNYPVTGFVEQRNGAVLSGWAYDRDAPNGSPAAVRLVALDIGSGRRIAGRWSAASATRLDVVRAGGAATPRTGFALDAAMLQLQPGRYQLRVEALDRPSRTVSPLTPLIDDLAVTISE